MFSFLLFFGLFAFTQQFSNQEATVTGNILCKNQPIRENTTVTIWDDDFIGDDELNSTMTDSNGFFYLYGQEFVYFSFQPFISLRHGCGPVSLCQCGKRCEYETRIWIPSTAPGETHHMGKIRLDRLPAVNATVITTASCLA
ncbi:unnamed protein product, partial [Mesorhabditis belari]|uniref:Transthyretin-like family protein n=1 Tax=Mesorhabditis belari TaxID=2138241 RepID=A0AAF3FSD9_9BILA